jgi:hypothetical protein
MSNRLLRVERKVVNWDEPLVVNQSEKIGNSTKDGTFLYCELNQMLEPNDTLKKPITAKQVQRILKYIQNSLTENAALSKELNDNRKEHIETLKRVGKYIESENLRKRERD